MFEHSYETNTLIDEKSILQKPKSNAGRPKGSKNKKTQKSIFMPFHKISFVNGHIEIDVLVKAIADLVWRQEGLMIREYVNLLNLTDSQKKYIINSFTKNPQIFNNKYWEISFNNKIKVLKPKMRRSGYYGKAQGLYDLFGLSFIAEHTNINKNTLLYRLKFMSIKDAIKNPGE